MFHWRFYEMALIRWIGWTLMALMIGSCAAIKPDGVEPANAKPKTSYPVIEKGLSLDEYPVIAEQRIVGPYCLRIREQDPKDSDPGAVQFYRVLEIQKHEGSTDKLVYLQKLQGVFFPQDFLPGIDLNGDGIPNVLIETDSGGNHCCRNHILLELGDPVDEVTRLGDDYTGVQPNFRVRGKDLLVDAPEWYGEWYPDLASSVPYVITVVIGPHGFHLDTRDLRRHHEDVDSLAAPLREAWEGNKSVHDPRSPIPPVELFQTLLQMCYTGAGQDAQKLLDGVWPKDLPGKDAYWERFMKSLRGSWYWEDIRKLNGWD
jgi:hypothetical protein